MNNAEYIFYSIARIKMFTGYCILFQHNNIFHLTENDFFVFEMHFGYSESRSFLKTVTESSNMF